MRASSWTRLANAIIAALALMQVLWEVWLAPLRPGGSWLALKALPLAVVAAALARHRPPRNALTFAALVLLAYGVEGVVRGYTERGRGQMIALTEIALCVAAFACLFRATRETAPRGHR